MKQTIAKQNLQRITQVESTFTALDFFAGCGLVSLGLKPFFKTIWANDICPDKRSIYKANHPRDEIVPTDIASLEGSSVPRAHLAWASFPCQDLSLAGKMDGLEGKRSGLLWSWLRVLDEMPVKPSLLAIENVVGLVSGRSGSDYRDLHKALRSRHYKAGAVVLDAVHWLPHSRPRVFVVAVPEKLDTSGFESKQPDEWIHTTAIQRVADGLDGFVLWRIGKPKPRKTKLADVLDADPPLDDEAKQKHVLSLIPPLHQARLREEMKNGFKAAAGYRRIRAGKQVLELRFDGVAGCLRTPEGGSSRQVIVDRKGSRLTTRLLTVREAAKLMGAPTYRLDGGYNKGYKAMGDAVAVPVVHALTKELLLPLAQKIYAK